MLAAIEHYGVQRGRRIADAFDSATVDLADYPELGMPEPDGRTRVLRRAELQWIYEVLDDRVLL